MKTQPAPQLDKILTEVKETILENIQSENTFHRDIDYEISMIQRCEHRGKIIDMKKHCKNALYLILKQMINNE